MANVPQIHREAYYLNCVYEFGSVVLVVLNTSTLLGNSSPEFFHLANLTLYTHLKLTSLFQLPTAHRNHILLPISIFKMDNSKDSI